MTAFVLGLYFGQRELPAMHFSYRNVVAGVAIIGLIGFWMLFTERINIENNFPFKIITFSNRMLSLLVTSTAISGLYAMITLLTFRMTMGLWDLGFIRFLARNTLFVFIIHMPLVYLLVPVYYPLVPSLILRIPISLTLFFLIPAVVSEILFKWIDLKHMRKTLFQKAQKKGWIQA
jgi:hypothetical protein